MTFVIAEIGVNWNGDLKLAKKMVSKAKNAGANAVKFQAFNEQLVKNHPQKKRLLDCAINNENIENINQIANSSKIEWFCTPMYKEAVDMLDPFVKRYKIREFDGRKIIQSKISPLLKKIFDTKKEVIISSQKNPPKIKNKKIKWLYCVPKYPCALTELNFKNLKNFDGYSNHCIDFIAPLTANILGAKIIEIHVTIDKTKKFIDNNVSYDFNEFKELNQLIRKVQTIKK